MRQSLQILLATLVILMLLLLNLVVSPMILSLVLAFAISVVVVVLSTRRENVTYPQRTILIRVTSLSVLAAAILGYVYWNYANIRMIPAPVTGTLGLTAFAGYCFTGLGFIFSAAFLVSRVESKTARTLFLIGLLVPSAVFLLIFVRYALEPPVEWVDEVVLVGYVVFTVVVTSAIAYALGKRQRAA